MPFSSFSCARRSSTSKLRAFRFSAPNTVRGEGISRPSPASETMYCASLRELNWYTFFTSSRSAVGMGSPVMASTSRTPSAYRPSSRAFGGVQIAVAAGHGAARSAPAPGAPGRPPAKNPSVPGQWDSPQWSKGRHQQPAGGVHRPDSRSGRHPWGCPAQWRSPFLPAFSLRRKASSFSTSGFAAVETAAAGAAGSVSGKASSAARRAAMWAGVVPQQPPRMRTPSAARRASSRAKYSGLP